MKRALVLSGGGARGAFQAGMLEELVVNQGIDFQVMRGVSVGALNAAFLAQAQQGNTDEDSIRNLKEQITVLLDIWTRQVEGNSSVYDDRGGFPGMLAGADSLYSLDPLQDLVGKNLDLQKLKSSGRDFKVGTVSLVSSKYWEWDPDNTDFVKKVMASASIPVVFPFVDLKNEQDVLVDGGVRNITPLASAFKAQPDEIYVLLTSKLIKEGDRLPMTCPI